MSFTHLSSMVAAMLLGVAPQAPPQGLLPEPVQRCRIDEAGLDELSGLASDGEAWYAAGDGGSSLEVYVLDPGDCSARDVRTAEVDPYDVEDLALGTDGALWLADTGDNRRQRDTVALHELTVDEGSMLYRLAYPDGAHDAEALLLDRAGVPYLVTKEPFGPAGIYRPAAPLASEHPVALEKVGSLPLRSTDTPGGPIASSIGSVLMTGGAVNQDGTAIALRTYTDAYLFSAPDGDLLSALQREPLRVPLPNEPQGEAVAWEPDGTLLSASEGQQPVRVVPGAAAAATEHAESSAGRGSAETRPPAAMPSENASEQTEQENVPTAQALLIAGCCAALIVFLGGRLRRSK